MSQCCSCLAAASRLVKCRPRAATRGSVQTTTSSAAALPSTAVARRASRLWSNLNEARRSFCEDVGQWGLGAVPIFTIVVSSDGRLQVQIDEEEISGRCSLRSMVSRRKVDAAQQIAKARKLARDIEQGLFHPPPGRSTLYRFVKHPTDTEMVTSIEVTMLDRRGMSVLMVGGLAFGLALAAVAFILLVKRRRSRLETETETEPEVQHEEPEIGTREFEEKMLKIRGMVKQAAADDCSGLNKVDDEEPEPVQYAAAVRSHLRNRAQQQKDEHDKDGFEGTLEGLERDTDVRVEASGDGEQQVEEASSEKRKVRIITSYAEAREVLAARKSRKMPAPQVEAEKGLASSSEVEVPKLSSEAERISAPSEEAQKTSGSSIVEAEKTSPGEQNGSMKAVEATSKPKRRTKARIVTSSAEASEIIAGKKSKKRRSPRQQSPKSEQSEQSPKEQSEPEKQVGVVPKTDNVIRKESREGATAAVQKYLENEARGLQERPKESRTVVTGNADSGDEPPIPYNPKKVWHSEYKRRYDRETDPKMRALLREIGKDLKSWIPESEVNEMQTLCKQGIEGRRELLRRWCEREREKLRQRGMDVDGEVLTEEEADDIFRRQQKIEERIQRQTAMFGPNAMWNKYRDYHPRKPDYLWWFDLRYVACIYLGSGDNSQQSGFFSMDMAKEGDEKALQHIIGFEDQHDALNFCRILVPTLDEELGGETGFDIVPYEPKKLFREACDMKCKVTVVKKGQLELYAGKPLYEVQDRILELGRDYYVQERLRETSIDFESVLEDLGRGL